jgi:acyl-CoA reductase-like NAD-dependent aldehyde dehydrogenase
MTHQEQKLKKQNEKPKIIKTKNPATEEILNEYDILTKEQINEAAKKAKDTFVRKWSTISIEKGQDFYMTLLPS